MNFPKSYNIGLNATLLYTKPQVLLLVAYWSPCAHCKPWARCTTNRGTY